MKKLMQSYRMTLLFRRVIVIGVVFVIATPAFLRISQKVKYYNNPTKIDYFFESLRTPNEENEILCAFQSDCLRNQRISWAGHSVYGPITGEKENAIYLIQMEDAYFVAVQGDLIKNASQIGGIGGKVDESLVKLAFEELSQKGIISNLEHTYLLSPYLLKQGYVGNASLFQFWLVSGIGVASIIIGIGLLIWIACCDKAKAYRAYQRLSLTQQRESTRELTHVRGMDRILMGEHLLYVRRKKKGAVHVLPYANLIWVAWDDVLHLCDEEGRYYKVMCTQEIYERLCDKVPYALQGEVEIYQEMMKHDLKTLLEKAKQKRMNWSSRNKKEL